MRHLGTRLSLAILLAFLAAITVALAPPVSAQSAAKTPQAQPAPQTSNQQAPKNVTCTVDVSPKTLSASIANALHLYRTGKFDEAASAYNAVISAGGTDLVLAYTGLARVYLGQEKVSQAFAAANSAVALTPGKTPAITALGEVYFRQGKLKLAEESFLNPLRACDVDARSYLGLSRLYRATSNYERAKKSIDQAYKLDPEDPDIQRSYMYSLSRFEVVAFLRAYLSRETDDDTEHRQGLERQLQLLEDESRQKAPCRITSKVTATQTSMETLLEGPNRLRGYGLKVKVNNASAKLMLDTGASGITIDKKIAEKAGVKKIAESFMRGIGDKPVVGGYIALADTIQIGDLQFENCYVDVVNRNSVLEDDGLIGADVFASYLVDIDFPNSKFKLSQLPPYPDASPSEASQQATLESQPSHDVKRHDRYIAPDMKEYTPIFRFSHMILIPTEVNNSPPMLFAMDTGAFDNTITPYAAQQVTKIIRDTDARVRGLSGDVKNVYVADKANLKFAHFKQDRQDLVTFSLDNISNSLGTEVSGLLGFRMLYLLDIKIDYRDGLVNFTYNEPGAKPKH
jgi:tetratricopeptide (TPR) repeat protein